MARYIAPVSKYTMFSCAATIFAMVLLPAPAGPSMAICMLLSPCSRRKARARGNLNIEAAGEPVDIDHLPGKIKAGDPFRSHGFGIDLRGGYPAGCHNRRIGIIKTLNGKGQMF